ncbi:MAG: DUF1343 domain-containing protein [Gemmatimonadaceae bacterium]|jgi:uncharacterized protein YbbC (DUF1343 family)|nr:DUF1343 domain-containing protein [Gemmatimonadaceae bacterium]
MTLLPFRLRGAAVAALALTAACAGSSRAQVPPTGNPFPVDSLKMAPVVRPGISVLLEDSLALIAGKRVGLLTNQSGIDERRVSDIDRLFADPKAKAAGVTLVRLFAPEHGIRGTEDRINLADEVDAKTGLRVISLYGRVPMPPADSLLRDLDVLVVDLQDLGARPWTYPASMLYALRAAAKHRVRLIVLDRPNPIGGHIVEGPIADSALTNHEIHAPPKMARPTALFPIPLRHGLTMGEQARFYNAVLGLGADLRVIPAAGWTRTQWFDLTGLPWVKPSPNMPDLVSAMLYPGMVAFEPTNVSVGRGTPTAFQLIGAPWMDPARVLALLDTVPLPGVRLSPETFTPVTPGDSKYGGKVVRGLRITVVDRERLRSTSLFASLFWAIAKAHRDSLKVRDEGFDRTFGPAALRQALLAGESPRTVMARDSAAVAAFRRRVAPFLLYR